jgi:hypothetical protein
VGGGGVANAADVVMAGPIWTQVRGSSGGAAQEGLLAASPCQVAKVGAMGAGLHKRKLGPQLLAHPAEASCFAITGIAA